MYFQVSETQRKQIESIQSDVILSLGANPSQIARDVAEQNGNLNLDESTLVEEHELWRANPYFALPEYHYDTSLDYYRFLRTFQITRFDRAPFLQRFTNLIPLCHDFQTNGDSTARKNIIISSLPYMSMNGVCVPVDNNTHTIFMNEGVLTSLRPLYQLLLPLCNPLFFGKSKPDSVMSLFNMISGLYFFKESYAASRDDLDFTYAHANERWLFRETLKASISKGAEKASTTPVRHPNEYPFNAKMALFLGCRGALVYLLGHEFSHVYQDHCQVVADGPFDLRNPEFHNQLLNEHQSLLKKYQDDDDDNAVNYLLHQPLEEEADAHGIATALRYCEENELDERRATCVMVGAASTFILTHLQEHFEAIHAYGPADAREYIELHPLVRNKLIMGEHPTAISRFDMALRHHQFHNSPTIEALRELSQQVVNICERMSFLIYEHSDDIERHLAQAEHLQVDTSEIFDRLCLGAKDIERRHLVRARRLRKSRAARIFSRFKFRR